MMALTKMIALMTGVPAEDVTIDRDHRRATAPAAPLPGATLSTYRMLEARATNEADGWAVSIIPPQEPMPEIGFADNVDTLDDGSRAALATTVWAAKRWNIVGLAVPGLAADQPPRAGLAARRAFAIADILRSQGLTPVAAPSEGQRFRLRAATPDRSD